MDLIFPQISVNGFDFSDESIDFERDAETQTESGAVNGC